MCLCVMCAGVEKMDSGLQDELDLNGALLLVTKRAAEISTVHIDVTLQAVLTIYLKRH